MPTAGYNKFFLMERISNTSPGFSICSIGLRVSGFSMIGVTGSGFGVSCFGIFGAMGITLVKVGADLIIPVAMGKKGTMGGDGGPPYGTKPDPLFG